MATLNRAGLAARVTMLPIDPAQLECHLRVLVETIGVRLAGSAGESAAADYVAAEFERVGAVVRMVIMCS